MSRQRLTIGTFGDIGFLTSANGRVVARARYRDWDGKNRLVQATGDTQRAAELALKAKVAERGLFQQGGSALTPDSPFPDMVAYWLEDLALEDRLSKTTLQLYERNMRTLVLPAFEHLTLREIGVARCDHFLKQLAKQSYNRAKQARVVLRLALGLAVRHEVLPRNPMDHVSRLRRPVSTPNALTPAEVNAIRAAITIGSEARRAARCDSRSHARHVRAHRRGARDPAARHRRDEPRSVDPHQRHHHRSTRRACAAAGSPEDGEVPAHGRDPIVHRRSGAA